MDHATVITSKVMLIISSSAPPSQLRQELSDMFSDEIAAIERQIANDRRLPDA
jgi:hypothetical protein